MTVGADTAVNTLSVAVQKSDLAQSDHLTDSKDLAEELSAHLPEIWSTIRMQLRAEYGARTFESWLKPLELGGLDEGVIIHQLPNGFMRDWIKNHFAHRLFSLWQAQLPFINDVRFDVVSTRASAAAQRNKQGTHVVFAAGETVAQEDLLDATHNSTSALNVQTSRTSPATASATPLPHGDGIDPSGVSDNSGALLDPRFTFDRFVVGSSNRFAFTAAQRIAEGGAVTFNPLFLHSSVGLGKTHLMHAIAWEIRNRHPQRKVLYMSAEKFMVEFVSALRHQDTVAFKQRFRNVDVLMIDDVQFIAGKNSTQDEFFHTFNALIDYRRQLIISADRSPSDLEGIEERIRSRLGWGLVADIHPTDYELRLGILHSKLEKSPNMQVPAEVLEFLARRITSNIRELEGALNRVVAHGTLVGRPITLEFTKTVLQDLLRANDRKITIDEIQRKVAEYYKVRMADLLSARRSREVARPRQVAMYLAKRYTPRSLPEIGRKFGGRDHTTVIHAVKRIEELRTTDSELDGDLNSLSRLLDI